MLNPHCLLCLVRGMFVLRSGLRFSFWELEMPEPRVRKRSFSLTNLQLLTGWSYWPKTNTSELQDLFRDTPLDHIWCAQIRTQVCQIWPNLAKYAFLAHLLSILLSTSCRLLRCSRTSQPFKPISLYSWQMTVTELRYLNKAGHIWNFLRILCCNMN